MPASPARGCWAAVKQALEEILDEERPCTWCSKCRAWVETGYSSGNEWCMRCNGDVVHGDNQSRYEELARLALSALSAAVASESAGEEKHVWNCGYESEDGYLCDRPEGHEGDHFKEMQDCE